MPVARRIQALNNRVFKRITRDRVREDLAALGLAAGDTVYARVSMRSVGYAAEGPGEIVAAVLDIIGPTGTLVMPAWPSSDMTRADPPDPFDLLATPSGCGLLSETLRTFPAARRSLHPVASVAAVGQRAEELVAHHEEAATPFGAGTPFGRLIGSPMKILLAGTHLGGILRAVQDRVGFPNLYAPEPRPFRVIDASGRTRTIMSLVPGPTPPVVILPGNRPENRDYMLMNDYALMFPPEREREVLDAGYLRFNRSRFLGRRDRLRNRGILTLGRLGSAQAGLLDGTRMLEQIEKDLAWDVMRFKEEYDAEQLAGFGLPVF